MFTTFLSKSYSPRNSHEDTNFYFLLLLQDLLQNSSPSLNSVSSTINPSGIVVPAGSLQQNNVAMTTINSQVVSGEEANHQSLCPLQNQRSQFSKQLSCPNS